MQEIEITRVSPLSGKTNTRTFLVDRDKYRLWMNREMAIQDACPHLSPGDREFMISGYTEEDWKEIFGDPHDDAEDAEPDIAEGLPRAWQPSPQVPEGFVVESDYKDES